MVVPLLRLPVSAPCSRAALIVTPLCSLNNKAKILSKYHVRRFPQASATAVDDEITLTRRAVPRGRQASSNSPSPRSSSPQAPAPRVVRFIVPEFVTAPGQIVALVGSSPALGNWDASRAVRLVWQDGHRWAADVHLQPGWSGALEFKLALIDGACAVWEPGRNRLLVVDKPTSSEAPLEVVCCWASCGEVPPTPSLVQPGHMRPLPHPLSSSPRGQAQGASDASSAAVTVLLPLPTLPGHVVLSPTAQLVLTGSSPQLGNWDPSKGLVLRQQAGPDGMPGFSYTGLGKRGSAEAEEAQHQQQLWMASVRLPLNKLIEAKIAVLEDGKPVQWEAGPNRSILLSPTPGAYIRPAGADSTAAPGSSRAPETAAPRAAPSGSPQVPGSADLGSNLNFNPAVAAREEARVTATAVAAPEGGLGGYGQAGPLDGAGAGAASGQLHGKAHGSAGARSTAGWGGYRARGRGGRGGTSSAELAELLGVVDSDDEDSRFDDDGRPRGASAGGAAGGDGPAGGSGGNGKVHVMNNILSMRRGELQGASAGGAAAEAAGAEAAQDGGAKQPRPRASSGRARAARSAAAQQADAAPFPGTSSAVAPADGPAAEPAPPSFSSSGGDYVVTLHWGCPSCSRAVYRPPIPPGLPPRADCATAATALVHITVPLYNAQQGQQLIVTGSSPLLGGWDPSKGLQLKWGPGHRWTGHIELPMEETDFKVVLYSRGQYMWEPGSNRQVDLGELVAEGSSTGAGEVHLTCSWGLGPATAALVVSVAPPAVVMEVLSQRAGSGDAAGLAGEGAEAQREEGEEGEAEREGTTVVLDSVRERDQSDSLIKLLSVALSSLMLPAAAAEAAGVSVHVESEEVGGLRVAVASQQAQVEELQQRLAELAAAAEQQRGAAAAAEAELAAARVAAAEAAAGVEAEAAARQQRHTEEVGTLRSGYESRILELQQQYEARILYLQQHEARMLGLQQQHSQELARVDALHQQALAEVKAALQSQEQLARRLQQAQQLAAKQHESALRQEQEQNGAARQALERRHLAEVGRLEQGRVRDTDALLARIKDVEAQAGRELRAQAAKAEARLQQAVQQQAVQVQAALQGQGEAAALRHAADAAAAEAEAEAGRLRLQLQQLAAERDDLLLAAAGEGRHERDGEEGGEAGMASPPWLRSQPLRPRSFHWWSGSEPAASPPSS